MDQNQNKHTTLESMAAAMGRLILDVLAPHPHLSLINDEQGSIPVADDSLESPVAIIQGSVPVVDQQQYAGSVYSAQHNFSDSRTKKKIIVPIILIILLLLTISGLAFAKFMSVDQPARPQKFGSNQAVVGVSPEELLDLAGSSDGTLGTVTINTSLVVNGQLVVAPSLRPEVPLTGQIYFDKDTSQINYYNGRQYISLTPGIAGATGAPGPAGLQGLAGANGTDGTNGTNGIDGADGCSGDCVALQPASPGTAQAGHINVSGTVIASFFQGNGSSISSVDALLLAGNGASFYTNASNISSGTLADGRLSANVSLLGSSIQDAEVDNNLTISATGSVADGALSANVTLLGASIALGTETTGTYDSTSDTIADDGAIQGSEITDGTIEEVDLEVTNGSTNGYILSYDSATGGFTWVVDTGGTCPGCDNTADTIADDGAIQNSEVDDDLTISAAGSVADGALSANVSLLGQTIEGSEITNGTIQGIDVENDTITDIQLAFNTGQHLTTTSNVQFAVTTATGIFNANATGKTAIQIADSGAQDSGITIGGDTNLYRSNASELKTDDNLVVALDAEIQGGDLTTNQTTFSLLNTTATTLNIGGASITTNIGVATGFTTINNAEIGAWPASNTFAYFGHSSLDHSLAGNFALLQSSTGATFLNASSGQVISLRINNTTVGSISSTGLTMTGDVAANGGDLTTTSTGTATLFNTNAVGVNIGGAVDATGVNLAGGSGSSGCTIDGSNGNLTCSGALATTTTSGTQGWWNRTTGPNTLAPVNAGDNITTSGNISTSGTGTITSSGLLTASGNLQADGNTVLGNAVTDSITLQGQTIASGSATGTTGTTTGTGTNTSTLTLTADAFAVNDVVFIDNVGQDYYTRITVDPGTGSYTVSPAVTFETGRTVTKYNVQNIGATTTDYTTQANRFFQGYFTGGIVTGAGSTALSDGSLISSGTLNIQSASTLSLVSPTAGLQITTAGAINDIDGNLVLDDTVDIGSSANGIRVATDGSILDINANLVLNDVVDIGSATTGLRVDAAGTIFDIDGTMLINDTVDIGSAASGIRVATDGTIIDNDGNINLSDTVDVGGASGIRVNTSGYISDIDTATVRIEDGVDIIGTLGVTSSSNYLSTSSTEGYLYLNSGNYYLRANSNILSTNSTHLYVGMGTTIGCVVDGDGTIIAGTCSSDERLKKNITTKDSLLERFSQLRVVDYNWRQGILDNRPMGEGIQTGVIAQELEALFPELVTIDSDGYKAVDYTTLGIYNIKATTELNTKVDGLLSGAQDASFANLNVSGSTTLDNLIVEGPAVFKGTLLVEGKAIFKNGVQVSGDIEFDSDRSGTNVAVANDSTSLEVTFTSPMTDTKYRTQITPSWDTNIWVTDKTINGYRINFKPAPPNSTLDHQTTR